MKICGEIDEHFICILIHSLLFKFQITFHNKKDYKNVIITDQVKLQVRFLRVFINSQQTLTHEF